MNIILWVIFGALVGWTASMITDRNNRQGIVGDVVLGVIGAVVGGFLMYLIGRPGVTGFNFYSIVISILGAVTVIWAARAVYKY